MGLLIDASLVAALVFLMAYASVLLGPKARLEGDAGLPYETGLRPMDSALERMSVPYVKFAVLFVIFDVDLAFLLPWARLRDRLDLGLMIAVTVFVGVIALMLAYVWKKGLLECS